MNLMNSHLVHQLAEAEMTDIQLQTTPLSEAACRQFVADDKAGAIVLFSGTVRNQTQGKAVLRLEFEAYAPMAVAEMRKIAEQAVLQFDVLKICIHHRVGILEIGDIPVVIAVSAKHRAAAFEACRFCIDTLKQTVPIWKKEIFEDGAVWVAAHP
jgi:molybdopterin synthase catalytic subunit